MKGRGTKRASPLFLQIIRQQQKRSFSSVATEWGTPRHPGGDDLQRQIKFLGIINITAAGKLRGEKGHGEAGLGKVRERAGSWRAWAAKGGNAWEEGGEEQMKYRGEDGR
jgi:hypothetical protein